MADKVVQEFLGLLVSLEEAGTPVRYPFSFYADKLGVKRLQVRQMIQEMKDGCLISCRSVNVHGVRRCQIRVTRRGKEEIQNG